MTTVAGGVIGAAIGGFGWGWGSAAVSIGWAIGSAIGSYADQPDVPDQFGPRLDTLKIQDSSYGAFIKRVYGRDRVGGSLIWLANNRIEETRHEEDIGGKGGDSGTQTTYTYSASFAVAVCEGPIAGIRRIWADSVLIYDRSTTAGIASLIAAADVEVEVYNGTEDQEPDGLMESYLGDVPAYRGTAYAVFRDLELDKYGRRIPNLTFEVLTDATATEGPITVNTWGYDASDDNIPVPVVTSDGTYTELSVPTNQSGNTEIDTYAHYTTKTFSGSTVRSTRLLIPRRSGAFQPVVSRIYRSTNLLVRDNTGWLVKDRNGRVQSGGHLRDERGEIITSSAPQGNRYGGAYDGSGNFYFLCRPYAASGGTYNCRIYQYQQRGDYPKRWSPIFNVVTAGGNGIKAASLAVEAGGYIYACGTSASTETLWAFDPETMAEVAEISGFPYTINDISRGRALTLTTGTSPKLVQIDVEGETFSDIYTLTDATSGPYSSGALFADANNIISRRSAITLLPLLTPNPVVMSDILDDLCEASGLGGADYDNAAISDEIDGYTVQSLQALRDNVRPLMPIGRFDIAQIDWQLQAVKRGADPVLTIAADYLAAHEYGQERPNAIAETRTLDKDLPREVIVEYNDTANDYQRGLQRASRISVDSRNVVDLATPVAMSATLAAQTADIILKSAWTERNRYNDIPLPARFSAITPTDVIEIQAESGTYTLRVTEKDDHVGLIKLKGVADRAADYQSGADGVDMNLPGQIVGLSGPTLGLLLDIPILRDQDDSAGFYVAATGYLDGWGGAVLFKSPDGGETYASVLPMPTGAAIGSATNALPDGSHTLIDEIGTVNISLVGEDSELSSISRTAMLNGGNLAAIGQDDRWEIIAFQTATLEADGTYTLSNMVRGLRGTEWATGTHQVGDTFVLLNQSGGVQRITANQAELNAERVYKFVSFGRRLAGAEEVLFTNEGVGLKPFAPRYVRGSRDGSDNLTVSWYARGRIGSGFRVSQDDITGYEVDVLDGSTVVRTLETTDTGDTVSLAYTAADQTTDFGSPQSSVTVRVYAIHDVVGRGYAAEATI